MLNVSLSNKTFILITLVFLLIILFNAIATLVCAAAFTFVGLLAAMVLVVLSGVVDVLMVGDREGVVKIDGCRLLCDLLCERCLSKFLLVK
jgi:uncharacterized membrane protein